VGFVRRPHVRLADDFNQRYAAAVEIDVSVAGRVRKTVMHALAQYVRQSRMTADTILETVFLPCG